MPQLKPTPDIIPTEPPKKPNATKKTKAPKKKASIMEDHGGRNPTLPPALAALDPTTAMEMGEDYNPLTELLSVGKDEADIDARSEVNELQMIHMARARVIASHFDVPRLNDFVRHILTLSLSKNRKSRKEFVQAFQAANMGEAEAQAGIIANMTNKLRS